MSCCFNLCLANVLEQKFKNDPKFWVGSDHEFFAQPDLIKKHIDRDNAICIVHCVFAGTRLKEDQDFLYWIKNFYQSTRKNTKLVFIHCDLYPELSGIEKIKFIHYPEYFSNYYKVFKGYQIDPGAKIQKKFLSLNKRVTMHRQLLYRAFLAQGLMEQSWFSYLGQSTYLGPLEDLDTDNWIDKCINEWLIESEDSHLWPEAASWPRPAKPWIYISESDETFIKTDWNQWNDQEGFGSDREEPSWFPDTHYYRHSFCSVVTETDPISWRINISEKSIRELAYGHPFILIGCRHSVKLLRNLGFDMFDDIIDHGYDDIENDILRFKAAWDSVLKINRYSLDDLQTINCNLTSRRQKNIEHLAQMYDQKFQKELEIAKELEILLNVPLLHQIDFGIYY